MNQLEGRKLKISVITPSHNRFEYLKEAVVSVQVNVLAPLDIEFEHIIHDCGSTDGTKDYFIANLPPERIFYIKDQGDNKEAAKDRQWIQATKDSRKDGKGELADNIIFIRSEHKVPPSQARTICIQKSTGQFICVLDDDDIFLQRTIHNFANAILQNPTKKFYISDFLRVNEHLQYMAKEDYYGWVFSSPHEMLQAIFDSCHFVQGNVCFSRKLYDEVGGYDEKVGMAEDLDLYVRFLIHGHLNVYLPIISHLHRMHTANFSIGCDRDKHHGDLTDIYRRNEARLQNMGVKLTLTADLSSVFKDISVVSVKNSFEFGPSSERTRPCAMSIAWWKGLNVTCPAVTVDGCASEQVKRLRHKQEYASPIAKCSLFKLYLQLKKDLSSSTTIYAEAKAILSNSLRDEFMSKYSEWTRTDPTIFYSFTLNSTSSKLT